MGKIVSDIRFYFIINGKNISIVRFELELSNKSVVQIKAYNSLADFCYKGLKYKDTIFIYGILSSTGEIQTKRIIKI